MAEAKGKDKGEERIGAVEATRPRGGGIEDSESQGAWQVARGRIGKAEKGHGFNDAGVEPLDYSNPYRQTIERVWYDGKIVFALSGGDVDVPDAKNIKVAQEYQPVYSVELDAHGKAKKREEVPGQYNIYDSIPGQSKYSPIWQFNFVVVPRDYQAQSLRSVEDCKESGYPIHSSNVFEN